MRRLDLRDMVLLYTIIAAAAGAALAQSGWTQQSSGTDRTLSGVSLVDSDNGFAVGADGTILRTTDGGVTWNGQISGTTNGLTAVSFVDTQTGTVVGLHGTILRTIDGGASWKSQDSGTEVDLFGVSFVDADTGTAVGANGTILRTTDGGATWTDRSSQKFANFHLRSVSFADPTHELVVGGPRFAIFQRIILSTVDGGENWTVRHRGNGVPLSAVAFAGTETAVAVGAFEGFGVILRSSDGGNTWEQQLGLPPSLFGVCFVDANTGTAVGARILRTTDGGETWRLQDAPAGNVLFAVSFANADTGVAVGARGTILRTDTGGN